MPTTTASEERTKPRRAPDRRAGRPAPQSHPGHRKDLDPIRCAQGQSAGQRRAPGSQVPCSPSGPGGLRRRVPEVARAATAPAAARHAERQLYSRLFEIPCRRATSETSPPAASTSAISAAFSSSVHCRRRSTRATISPSTSAVLLYVQKDPPSLTPSAPTTHCTSVQTGRLP